jgi:hypothetical protein
MPPVQKYNVLLHFLFYFILFDLFFSLLALLRCKCNPKKIVHNISDLAKFGYILDIKLEKKIEKRIHESKILDKKIFVFLQKNYFLLKFFFSKFQHLKHSI